MNDGLLQREVQERRDRRHGDRAQREEAEVARAERPADENRREESEPGSDKQHDAGAARPHPPATAPPVRLRIGWMPVDGHWTSSNAVRTAPAQWLTEWS